MRKRLALIICTLFLFSLVGCSTSTENKTIDELNGIKFEVPGVWSENKNSQTVKNFQSSLEKFKNLEADGKEFSMKNNGIAIITYMELPVKPDEKTQNSLTESMKKVGIDSILGKNSSEQSQQSEEIIVDGQKAQRTFGNFKKNNQEEYFEVVITNNGKRTYMMIFLANKSDQESLKKDIDNLLESVKFSDENTNFKLPQGAKKGENIDLLSGIQFGVPDGWFAILDEETSSKVQTAVPEAKINAARINTPYFGNGSIIKMEMPVGSTENFKTDLSEKLIRGMLINLQNIKDKTVEDITIDGKTANRTTFSFVQSEMEFYLDLVSVSYGDDFYVIMINGEMDQKQQIQQGMSSIINSIKF